MPRAAARMPVEAAPPPRPLPTLRPAPEAALRASTGRHGQRREAALRMFGKERLSKLNTPPVQKRNCSEKKLFLVVS